MSHDQGDRRGSNGGRSQGRSQSTSQQLPRRPTETTPRHPASSAVQQGAATHGARSPYTRSPPTNSQNDGATASTSAVLPAASGNTFRGRDQQESRIATRPDGMLCKLGTSGTRIQQLTSNYFKLTNKPNFVLRQYRVDFTPDIEFGFLRFGLLRNHEAKFGKYIFDGTLLYCVKNFPKPLELISERNSDGSDVSIKIRLIKEVFPVDAEYTTVMNLIFRRCLNMLNLVMMKRNYFDADAAEPVPNEHINIWPGYFTTIHQHETSLLLGVDFRHKMIRTDSAYHVMDKIRQSAPEDFSNRVKAALEGQIVMTTYNKKTYRIDDIDFEQNPASKFHHRKENRHMTYHEYCKTRYEQEIKNLSQPLLVSRPSRRDINRGEPQPIFLVPELCIMTGLSDQQRGNDRLMRAIKGITNTSPDKRVAKLMRFRNRLADNPRIQEELNSWGLQFDKDTVECAGRVLTPKTILHSDGAKFNARDGDWSRQIQRSKMYVNGQLNEWIVLYPADLNQPIRDFVRLLKQFGAEKGFIIRDPKYCALKGTRDRDYIEKIKDEVMDCEPPEIVMCVLRSKTGPLYTAIKKFTLKEIGILSQVMVQQRIRPQNPATLNSIATKVMIQMAAKCGSEPWRIELPKECANWMVIGYDTYHNARQTKAVGAFVASINPTFSKFNSSASIHENNEEISTNFERHFLMALKQYYIHNGKKMPDRIIVYRDAVGAGDIQRVLDIEVEGLKEACRKAQAGAQLAFFEPAISFVIVSKRINTRFFQTGGRVPLNPPCGTVVDNTVTLPERFDFFLVSQKVNQGTASPTSYNVIFNDSGKDSEGNILARLGPNPHQIFAYALTHMYYNWPGTLSLPAPVQYAHKLAYLVGENLGDTNSDLPKDGLSTSLYYL